MPVDCPLCNAADIRPFCKDAVRAFFRCPVCRIVIADPATHLTPDAEKARYDFHQNDINDAGYRGFLNRLAQPLIERLGDQRLTGLDFGCGPGPALAAMLSEAGHTMAVYDPYYAPDSRPLNRQYDFIVCTEAIEHFRRPGLEWDRLLALLRPGGWLGIMTSLIPVDPGFADWHYKNDPTHVSFFSRETFAFLAERDALSLEIIGKDVMILRRHGSRSLNGDRAATAVR